MGKEGDATPFAEVTVDNISAALHTCGYQSRGWETMYNGHTGRRLQAQIFLNPTYYQRLKHMVRHCATGGPSQQPLPGSADLHRGYLMEFGSHRFLCLLLRLAGVQTWHFPHMLGVVQESPAPRMR